MWPFTPWPLLTPPSWARSLLRLLTIGPTLLSLPFAALYNSATYFLYRPKRGFGRHLGVNVFRYLGTVVRMGLVAAPDHEAWDIPKLAQKHFLGNAEVGEVRAIPPIRDDVPRLPVLSSGGDAIAPPEDIPGFMLAPKGTPKEEVWAKAKPGEKGIFYLIGGGYEVGHPLKFFCIWEIVRDTGLRSFSPNFRKTVRADQAWPTQVWDILAGWQYMVDELGFEPQNIVVTGSSAGGHATLTLVRYLDELLQQGWDKWGMPAGFYASAPPGEHTGSLPSYNTHKHTDWLTDPRTIIFPALLRHIPNPTSDAYLCPAFMPTPDAHFQRLAERGTVAYVDAGTDEVLWDSVTRVVENMKAAGLNVKFTAYEGGTHCEYVFARTPIKLWPGVGFTWTLFLAQFKSCLKECWPDVVFPGA